MSREDWLKERRSGIGGTDWQHILVVPPYGCSRMLWYDKTGVEPDVPDEEKGYMRRGTVLEPIVAKEFTEDSGYKVRRPGRIARNPSLPDWWRGSLDYVILPREGNRTKGVLDCKTTAPQILWRVKREGPPEGHIAQIHAYFGITGSEWGVLAYLDPLNWELLPWWVDRDQDMVDMMLTAGELFWRRVENGPAPDPIQPPDKRCHRCRWRITCQGSGLYAASDAYDADGDVEEIDDYTLESLVRQREELREVESEAAEQVKLINSRIREHLGGYRRVTVGPYRVYWTPCGSSRVDLDALRSAHPDIVDKYTVNRESARLVVYS